jgi:hypothetical protein
VIGNNTGIVGTMSIDFMVDVMARIVGAAIDRRGVL